MNILQLEEQRRQLIEDIHAEKSSIASLYLLNNFFNQILSSNDETLYESFLSEFIEQYINNLENFNPIGLSPEFVEQVINNAEKLSQIDIFSNIRTKLNSEISRITKSFNNIQSSLRGEALFTDSDIYFPVNIYSDKFQEVYGQIETFSIKIHTDKYLTENKFLVIPSNQKLEERLKNQIEVSWNLAFQYLSEHYGNVKKFHEVIIVLKHKHASYEGYSLGLSLTLGFIQELFKFYNTELSLKVKNNIILTGGIDNEGKVISIGNDTIKKKTDTVFYSTKNIFALPNDDFNSAQEQLNKLKQKYPKRLLKLIRISDFEDLLNHRQIVDITKTPIIKRITKLAKKNSMILFLSSILLAVAGFFSIYSLDNNPVEFEQIGETLNILNKHGKIIWSSKTGVTQKEKKGIEQYFQRVFDINNDGINEVLLANEKLEKRDMDNHGRIACFDNKGNLLWKYKFKDTVYTERYTYKDIYISRLVDIVNLNGKNILFANARHLYFPSAIYKLDIETGKRLQGTLWSQGHLTGGCIDDFNEDGNYEIFIGGINNGMESAFALVADLPNLTYQTPSLKKYLFKNIPIGSFTKYFLFPKTDICNLYENRFNSVEGTYFSEDTKTFGIGVNERYPTVMVGPQYLFNNKLDSAQIQIGDDYQFIRDSLVIKGRLKPPLTTDPLYSEILVKNIKEWNGKEFVPFYKGKK